MADTSATGSPTDYQQDGRSNIPRVQRKRNQHFSEAVTAAQTPNVSSFAASGTTATAVFSQIALGTGSNTGLTLWIDGVRSNITNVAVATATDLNLTIPTLSGGEIVRLEYDGQFEYLRDTGNARPINSFKVEATAT